MPAPSHRRRVTVVTSGHLSTSPRMLKAADALAAAGYQVQAVATTHEPWATDADVAVRARRGWPVTLVNYRRDQNAGTYWRTGIEHRAARAASGLAGVEHLPFPFVARAFARVHAALVAAIVEQPADLIYGGTSGALAAIAEAARRSRTPYALDLEDFHSAESSGADAPLLAALAKRVEGSVLGGAAFLTTSSEAIAAEYDDTYGIAPAVIHNTFPLPSRVPDFSRTDPATLRLFWFSQTIGAGRGLEEAVSAIGRLAAPAELMLLGRPDGSFVDSLRDRARLAAPQLRIAHRAPVAPDDVVDAVRGYDIGLALELSPPRNRELCLTNKALTYILAGVPVLMADTEGQRRLGVDLGRGAALVDPRDIDGLAAAMRRWLDPAALDCAKRSAWAAAARRWHFEHDEERGVLHRLVAEALA